MNFNQRVFDVTAGFAVFIGVTLILSDYDPDMAIGIIGVAVAYLVLSHASGITKLLNNYQSALKG